MSMLAEQHCISSANPPALHQTSQQEKSNPDAPRCCTWGTQHLQIQTATAGRAKLHWPAARARALAQNSLDVHLPEVGMLHKLQLPAV